MGYHSFQKWFQQLFVSSRVAKLTNATCWMVLWDQHFNRIYCHPQFCMRSHHRIRIMFETSWKFSEAAHSGAEFVAPKKKMFFVSLWKIRSLHSSTASTRPGQTVKRSDHNKRDDSTMGLFPGEVMMDILMNHVTWNCFGELPAGRSCCWWKIAGEPVNRWLILVYPYIYIYLQESIHSKI